MANGVPKVPSQLGTGAIVGSVPTRRQCVLGHYWIPALHSLRMLGRNDGETNKRHTEEHRNDGKRPAIRLEAMETFPRDPAPMSS